MCPRYLWEERRENFLEDNRRSDGFVRGHGKEQPHRAADEGETVTWCPKGHCAVGLPSSPKVEHPVAGLEDAQRDQKGFIP